MHLVIEGGQFLPGADFDLEAGRLQLAQQTGAHAFRRIDLVEQDGQPVGAAFRVIQAAHQLQRHEGVQVVGGGVAGVEQAGDLDIQRVGLAAQRIGQHGGVVARLQMQQGAQAGGQRDVLRLGGIQHLHAALRDLPRHVHLAHWTNPQPGLQFARGGRVQPLGDEDRAGATVGDDAGNGQTRRHQRHMRLGLDQFGDASNFLGGHQIAFRIELAFPAHAALRQTQVAQQFAVDGLQRQAAIDVVRVTGEQRDGGKTEGNGQQRHKSAPTVAQQAAQREGEQGFRVHCATSSLSMRPSRSNTLRSTCSSRRGSCVVNTKVTPCA